MRQERLSWRQIIAMVIGIAGILVLFGPQAAVGRLEMRELLGVAMLSIGTMFYCIGSVLCRPLLRTIPPVHLAGITNLIGGVAFACAVVAAGAGGMARRRAGLGLAGLARLALAGVCRLAGSQHHLFMLVRDWGASRTGSYAFVTPVIAVFLAWRCSANTSMPCRHSAWH